MSKTPKAIRRNGAIVFAQIAAPCQQAFSTALPLAVIRGYWHCTPISVRKRLSRAPGTSVPAYLSITAGGGWRAFWYHALPHRHRGPNGKIIIAWIVGPEGV